MHMSYHLVIPRIQETLKAHCGLDTKALDMKFHPSTSMSQVTNQLDALYARIISISLIDHNSLHSIFLLNALGEHYL